MADTTEKKWGEDVFGLISWFKTEKVKNAKIMVVGAGALGNEVLKDLALFGVGNLVVVDFDEIEYSNLTRSVLFRPEDADKGFFKAEVVAKRLREINPTINVLAINGDLAIDVGLAVYRQMDVIISCVDSVRARTLLNRLSFRAGKIWIDGGIGDLGGYVSVYQLGRHCYECTPRENIRVSCPQIARGNEKLGRMATTPLSASIIGAVQAQETMKIVHDEELKSGKFSTLIGKMFKYEGQHNEAYTYKFPSYEEYCISHEYWENIIEIPGLSADTKTGEALKIIGKALGVESVTINLRNGAFVDYLISLSDDRRFEVMLPAPKIPNFIDASNELEFLSVKDGGLFTNSYENIDEEFPYLDLTLNQIGIPHFDVLQITTGKMGEKECVYVELSADKERYKSLF